jgi:hypothetical protein
VRREEKDQCKFFCSDGSDCGSKKYRGGYGGAYGGVWWSLRLAEVWNQAVSFVLERLAGRECLHAFFSL